MDVGKYLADATARLTGAGIETARLDALILLEDIVGQSRAILLAHPETLLSDEQITALNNFVTRRTRHVPLAYIRGKAMFFGREFAVNTHVLVPRPETEMIIEILKNTPLPQTPRIADVGTGSGCIGITAGLEILGSQIFLYDIDPDALAIAQKNARFHNLTVHAAQQNLLAGCSEQFDVILANLPYVPDDYAINQAARHEPKLALFSGKDGLDHYRIFWGQVQAMASKPRYVVAESMPEHHKANAKLARTAGYVQDLAQDFIQRFVLLSATEE